MSILSLAFIGSAEVKEGGEAENDCCRGTFDKETRRKPLAGRTLWRLNRVLVLAATSKRPGHVLKRCRVQRLLG